MTSPLQRAEATRLGPPRKDSPDTVKEATGGIFIGPALAIALLPLALGLAACGEGEGALPTSEELVERLVTANTEPRDLHSTSAVTVTMNMPMLAMMGGDGGTEMTFVADSELWTDSNGRMRTESTTRIEGLEEELGSFPMGAMGGLTEDGVRSTVVHDGTSIYHYQESLNMWWRQDLAELEEQVAASGMPFDPDRIDELYRDLFDRMAAAYDVSIGGLRTVAGRRAIAFTAKPKAGMSDAERSVFGGMRLDYVDMTVDLVTWQPLASDISATIDTAAMAAAMLGGGGMEGMGDAMAGMPPMPFRFRTTTTSIDYEPVLSEDLFTFTPPEGAIEMDLGAFTPGADMDEESLEQMMKRMEEQMESNPAFQELFGTATTTP